MARSTLSIAVLFVATALAGAVGCGDDTVTGPPVRPYLEPTSPSNVVENLAIAYQRR